jgi:hypothetical protein
MSENNDTLNFRLILAIIVFTFSAPLTLKSHVLLRRYEITPPDERYVDHDNSKRQQDGLSRDSSR